MAVPDPVQERRTPSVADVTVIMPAKNRADLIERALDSVSAQTIPPMEVIVIDDGSTDGTADVAEAAGATVIRLTESGGSGPARNRGITEAKGEWIAFLDSDDEWAPDHLATLLARRAGVVLVSAPGLKPDGTTLGNPYTAEIILDPVTLLTPGDLMVTSGTIVRRQALLDAGLFRPLRRAQDLDLWIRVLELGPGLALNRPTVRYHLHEGQASNDKDLMRQCFDQIIDFAETRPWFGPKDRSRSYARVHWDELRLAQRERDGRAIVGHLAWFVKNQAAWTPLIRTLQQRRLRRRIYEG